jgi:biopolymer transport protein ExbD
MAEINVTPLVDVMLVLVVILIITAPLMASSLKLDLPKTQIATATEAPKFLSVGVRPDGSLYLADKPVDSTVLAKAFAQAFANDPTTEVQIRADQAAAYGTVAQVLATAQEAGLSRIGFITERVRK